ncbi:hypothetical protein H6F93_18650 [Leptolyngbya sp. FACHB-671]|uniref:hypothetical protein n=1 Tax=Leptolyngbya sp. FACHB-671 TaxID=2692812 RepID=UPI001686F9D5|nr:hypothetical protein [Leptolyngbya sp. FACHB-671]MBD2069518.1 hypothetical protein [Leptolyngbya sp. FACHB-671]
MRILEQSENVLTLQNSAINYWFGNISLLFTGPLLIIVLIASPSGWWGSLCFVLLAVGFLLALTNLWASDVVRICSFNKTLRKVTIKYYGFQAKIEEFPSQNVRAVEVRKSPFYAYGATLESARLWLIIGNFGAIPLSDGYDCVALSEVIAYQIREFLGLRTRSM